MKTQVIIAAAGDGKRLKSDIPKPLVRIDGKPLISYSLDTFSKCNSISGIIIAVNKDVLKDIKKILSGLNIKKPVKVISGGATRKESVSNALSALDNDTDFVAVHDAARPFIDTETVEKTISAAYEFGAAIVAVASKSTIKAVDPLSKVIETTLKRNCLWEAQTPQVFKKDMILKAHKEDDGMNATDDSVLVERLGIEVKIVEGKYSNIKITTKEDLEIAKVILDKNT